MDNHFHIVVKSKTSGDYSEEEINLRVKNKTGGNKLTEAKRLETLTKLGNISEYMKSIKENFSRWYNRRHHRSGYFWSDRFKSVILEKQATLAKCIAYVDLNPIRARIVKRPESYRWSSIHARFTRTGISKTLHFTGVFDSERFSAKEMLLLYRRFLYAVGAVEVNMKGKIPQNVIAKEKELGFEIPASEVIISRVKHFTDGCVIGSKDFIYQMYGRFAGRGIYKKERKSYHIGIDKNIHSLQRIRGVTA